MCEPLRGMIGNWDDYSGLTVFDILQCFSEYFRIEHVKSAVEFYKKHRYHAGNLKDFNLEIYNKFIKSLPGYKSLDEYIIYNIGQYNDWLFDYCFGDVIG